jgi:dihydroorotase
MPRDLLLAGGRVLDPSQSLNAVLDVGLRDGRIHEVGPALDRTAYADVIDVSGKYVCPGLIDLHGHWYEGNLYGVDPLVCLNSGVTTAVDAGSTGYANFPHFRRTVIDHSLTEILAFIHISFMGLHAPYAEELLDLRYARPVETAAVIAKHRDRAAGVKLRMGAMTGNHGIRRWKRRWLLPGRPPCRSWCTSAAAPRKRWCCSACARAIFLLTAFMGGRTA